MPKRRRSGRHTVPRRKKPRRAMRAKRLNRSKRSGPFPDKTIVTMRYVEEVPINAAAGLVATHVFRANSVFDPNFSGVGHQPYGHDTLATVYQKTRVLSSKCNVIFNTPSAAAVAPAVVGVKLSSSSVATANPSLIREQPHCAWTSLDSQLSVRVKKNYVTKRFFSTRGSKDLQALVGANPVQEAFFQVWVTAADDSVNIDPVFAQVVITYKVLWSDPLALGQS